MPKIQAITIELTAAEAVGVANMLNEGDAKPVEYRKALADKVRDQYNEQVE